MPIRELRQVEYLHLGLQLALFFRHTSLSRLFSSVFLRINVWLVFCGLLCILIIYGCLGICKLLHRCVLLWLIHFVRNLLVKSLEYLHELCVGLGRSQLFHLICVRVLELDFGLFNGFLFFLYLFNGLWLRLSFKLGKFSLQLFFLRFLLGAAILANKNSNRIRPL